MKTAYSYAILRYVHDVVTGEFVNVGVVLHAPEAKYLDATCLMTFGRLSAFFGGIEGERFRRSLRHIELAVRRAGDRLKNELPFEQHPSDALSWAQSVLPPDDSSLQFHPGGGGITADPTFELADLFRRYVLMYGQRAERPSRSDEEILRTFKQELSEKNLWRHVQPKTIRTENYEHEFPVAWKNGFWHACEAVSFDLVDPGNIVEKANNWVGRATSLRESEERFRLMLLVGEPRGDEKLQGAYVKARNILKKMPVEHQLIPESEAPALALMIERDLREEGILGDNVEPDE